MTSARDYHPSGERRQLTLVVSKKVVKVRLRYGAFPACTEIAVSGSTYRVRLSPGLGPSSGQQAEYMHDLFPDCFHKVLCCRIGSHHLWKCCLAPFATVAFLRVLYEVRYDIRCQVLQQPNVSAVIDSE